MVSTREVVGNAGKRRGHLDLGISRNLPDLRVSFSSCFAVTKSLWLHC
jgi:hypothetical protein